MARLAQRTATAIDEMSRTIWDQSNDSEKFFIGLVLIVTGLIVPVVPIVWVARYFSRNRHRYRHPLLGE